MRRIAIVSLLIVATVPMGRADAFLDAGGTNFERQQVWYHTGTTPIGTLDHQLGEEIGWSSAPPAGEPGGATLGNNYSVFLDIFEPGMREANTFTARGTFTGNLETIAVDLYYAGPFGSVCGMALAWDIEIDGVEILRTNQAEPSADLKEEAAGQLRRVRFILTNLHATMDLYDVPIGDGVEHDIYLNFANFYACNEAVWLYDTDAAPSGMIFNMDPVSPEAKPYTPVDVQNPPPPLPV